MLYFTLTPPDGSSENTRRNDKFPIDNFDERWYLELDKLRHPLIHNVPIYINGGQNQ